MNAERVRVRTDTSELESIDLYKPGTIEVKREGERKKATVERASTAVSRLILRTSTASACGTFTYGLCQQPGEGQLFTGTEAPAKDMDCVLVYDEDLGVCVALFLVPDRWLKHVTCFRRADLHFREARLSD